MSLKHMLIALAPPASYRRWTLAVTARSTDHFKVEETQS